MVGFSSSQVYEQRNLVKICDWILTKYLCCNQQVASNFTIFRHSGNYSLWKQQQRQHGLPCLFECHPTPFVWKYFGQNSEEKSACINYWVSY